MKQFTSNEIGVICNDYKEPKIVLHEPYKEGLKALEGFSHVMTIWWCDDVDSPERDVCVLQNPYVKGPDMVGVFSTRSPARPNPIAVTNIQIKSIDYQKGIIYTYYTDANDNTPLLDIKPYLPSVDLVKSCSVPSWCQHWPKSYEESGTFDWDKEFNF